MIADLKNLREVIDNMPDSITKLALVEGMGVLA
jgi:hypothetical protein